jgi:hypothetical protein
MTAENTPNSFETLSPLSQSFNSENKTVEIAIAANPDGGWLMKIVDQFGNSTNWEDIFASEQDALDEAKDALKQEGIALFIGIEGGFSYE